MKKFLAILLAMMLVMVSVVALATDGGTESGTEVGATEGGTEGGAAAGEGGSKVDIAKDIENPAPTEGVTFTLTKQYEVAGETGINPADELSFTVTGVGITETSNTKSIDDYEVTIDNVTVNVGDESADITVTLPAYDLTGVYSYTIKEDDTNIAGVEYLADTLYLNVTVATNVDTGALYIAGIAVHQASEDGTKIDEFTNTYTAGSLTVSKEVTGNLGDRTLPFDFTVEFTAPEGDTVNADITISTDSEASTMPTTIKADWTGSKEMTFSLKHGEHVTFENLPKGVTYTITEENGEYEIAQNTNASGTIENANIKSEWTNEREIDVDTGITLETLPYVLLMALAVMGLVTLKLRKREEY